MCEHASAVSGLVMLHISVPTPRVALMFRCKQHRVLSHEFYGGLRDSSSWTVIRRDRHLLLELYMGT
jgi:hypothetical protein